MISALHHFENASKVLETYALCVQHRSLTCPKASTERSWSSYAPRPYWHGPETETKAS